MIMVQEFSIQFGVDSSKLWAVGTASGNRQERRIRCESDLVDKRSL